MKTISEQDEHSFRENNENPYESEQSVKQFKVRANSLSHRSLKQSLKNKTGKSKLNPDTDLDYYRERLRESEHKRQEQVVKHTNLQKKSFEIETENARLRERFNEIVLKGASGILKEEYEHLKVKLETLTKEHS